MRALCCKHLGVVESMTPLDLDPHGNPMTLSSTTMESGGEVVATGRNGHTKGGDLGSWTVSNEAVAMATTNEEAEAMR